ncbi:MAG TPA: hypothetical protein PK869_00350 [Candidatus Hydrogenedentes bacterium]|nr:hypothetical protein [Candidatus Hydrogenedentota bacterium]
MRKWSAFILVVFVTFGARVYGVASESVWYDEAISVAYLHENSLPALLDGILRDDALKVPMYFYLQYGWWHYISSTVVGLRWLTLLTSLLTVSALYWGAARYWGVLVASVASLGFALSIPMIFYGQEIRMYMQMYLFALLSWLALYGAARGSRQAWILNAVFNLLLIQTHLFGVFSVCVQFLFVIITQFRYWRRIAVWSAAQGAIGLTLVPWVMQFDANTPAMSWIPTPSVTAIFKSLLLVYPGASINSDYPLPVSWFPGMVAAAALAVALAAYGLRTIWRAEDRDTTLLAWLLCWLLGPPLTLFAVSFLFRPCYVDRYALYAAFPFFFLMAFGVRSLGPRTRAVSCVALLFLGVTNVSAIQRPIRPDMDKAFAQVKFGAAEGDRVVVRGMGYEFCLRTYLPLLNENEVSTQISIRKSVRDVARGERIWFVLDPYSADFARWMDVFDDAAANGSVRIARRDVIATVRPVHVFLLVPGEAAVNGKLNDRR